MSNRYIQTYQKESLLGIRFRVILYIVVLAIAVILFYLLRYDMLWNGFSLMAMAGSAFLLIESLMELFYFKSRKLILEEVEDEVFPIPEEIARITLKITADQKSRKVNQSIFLVSLLVLPVLIFFYKDHFLLGILVAVLVLSAIAQVFDMLENHSDQEYLYHLEKHRIA